MDEALRCLSQDMLDYISVLQPASELPDRGRKIVVLGSTGSIGQNVLRIAQEHPDEVHIIGLAGGGNIRLLAEQAGQWRPPLLAVKTPSLARDLRELLPTDYRPEIFSGHQGYERIARATEAHIVVSAQVGAAGLGPTMAAVKQGKVVALANKESLVLAGTLLRRACVQSGACILPVDSEHNALFQALAGHSAGEVRTLILTASGGPFRQAGKEFLDQVTPEQALAHPNWSMGAKISVDSATMMNKGLEVIEAHYLFGLDLKDIDVVVHPESIVHSLVEYRDGSLLSHMGIPDMRIPIAYCLSYPRRLPLSLPRLDLAQLGRLTFSRPDEDLFPCLALAKEALRAGPSYPVVLNAANEVAVELFLEKRISFAHIPVLSQEALHQHQGQPLMDLEDILELDTNIRTFVRGHKLAATV
ncbi:MAG: 1-deoxy-D-xylulose-5-phosphate reductoisomerase [Desulfovermiculus sp.]|nr:1-deoxy-D-xylulose-5-phosphate reductoisomerase [Desulfovermiculus sp.]